MCPYSSGFSSCSAQTTKDRSTSFTLISLDLKSPRSRVTFVRDSDIRPYNLHNYMLNSNDDLPGICPYRWQFHSLNILPEERSRPSAQAILPNGPLDSTGRHPKDPWDKVHPNTSPTKGRSTKGPWFKKKFEREMCELKWMQQQRQCKTNNGDDLHRLFKGLQGDTLRIHQNVDMISFFVGNIVSCTLLILRRMGTRMTRLRDRLANESVN